MENVKSLVQDLGIRIRVQDLPCVDTHLIQFEEFTKKDLVIGEWEFRLVRQKYTSKPGYITYEIKPYISYSLKPELLNIIKPVADTINLGYRFNKESLETQKHTEDSWSFRVQFDIKDGAPKKVLAKEKIKYIGVAKRKLQTKEFKNNFNVTLHKFLHKLNDMFTSYNTDNVEKNITNVVNNYILTQIPKTFTPMDLNLFKDLVPLIKEHKANVDNICISIRDVLTHVEQFGDTELKRFGESLNLTTK